MIVSSSAVFIPPGHPLEEPIRATAEIDNPAYLDHERMVESGVRSRMASKPPRYLQVWRVIPGGHAWSGGTMVPRSWEPSDLRLRRSLRAELFDHRSDGSAIDSIDLADGFELRDYQQDAVDAVADHETGVVVMPCGAGKTSTGVGLIHRLRRRTLILVHTKDLAQQWAERIGGAEELPPQLVGPRLGFVGMGRKRTDAGADIVIATIQTLTKWPWGDLYEWGRGFGLTILDEAHHAPAETFLDVLFGLPSRYRVGLTATPDREDGMGPLLWSVFDRVVHQVERGELVAAGRIRPARVIYHRTGMSAHTHEIRADRRAPWLPARAEQARHARALVQERGGDYPKVRLRAWNKQVDEVVTDESRNAQIVDLAAAKMAEGHSVIVLSERVEHCRALAAQLVERGVPAAAVAGQQGQREVSGILAAARRREIRVLCGTTKADEGLDVPVLSCGILATRTKRFGRLTQRIGRIERPEGLPGEWHDLIDDFPSSTRAARDRAKLYEQLGLEGAKWVRRKR